MLSPLSLGRANEVSNDAAAQPRNEAFTFQ